MAPTYKLTYFNVKGLGEPIRFLLAYGGQDFEDVRIEKENWPAIKSTMPFGQMPVLEVDGKKVYQSVAMYRYLGKQFKLAGDNDWEAMEIDIIADTITDMKTPIVDYYKATMKPETTEEIKAQLKEAVVNETFPFYLSRLDEIVKKNNGYFANGKLSWVDFYFASTIGCFVDRFAADILKDYPNLIGLKDRVHALPAIKEWVAKRP